MLRCVVFTGFGALSALVLSLPARADTAIGGRVSSQGFGLVLTQSIMPISISASTAICSGWTTAQPRMATGMIST